MFFKWPTKQWETCDYSISILSLTFHKKKIYFNVEKGCYSCDISIFLKDKKEKYTVAKSTLEHCNKYKYASHK